MLGRQIKNSQPAPKTLSNLRIALTKEWNNIFQEDMRNLILDTGNCFDLFSVQEI